MITREQYEYYKKLVAEYEMAEYEQGMMDADDEYDAEQEEEDEYERRCELAASCKCGAWQFNKNNEPIHVADCCCGAE